MNDPIFYLDGPEPELQLRLTAMVMGEASDLEREQLEGILQQRADAASWYRQLQQLHAGLAELAATTAADDDDWKLSADRRQQLLSVFDGETPNPLPATAELPAVDKAKSNNSEQRTAKQSSRQPLKRRKLWLVGIAASLLLVMGVSALQLSQQRLQLANFSPMSQPAPPEFRAEDFAAGNAVRLAPEGEASPPSPYYLSDDVEYFPAQSEKSMQRPAGSAATFRSNGENANGLALPATGNAQGQLPPSPTAAPGGSEEHALGMSGAGGRMGAYGGMGAGGGMGGGMGGYGGESSGQEDDFASPDEALFFEGNQPHRQLGVNKGLYAISPSEETAQGRFSNSLGGKPAQGQPGYLAPDANSPYGVWGSSATPELRGGTSQIYRLSPNAAGGNDERRSAISEVLVPDGDSLLLGGIRREARPELNRNAGLDVSGGEGLQETATASERFSTFSLHVSDVSFKLALAAFDRGEWPAAEKIRIEEFVNAMDYRDPLATPQEQVACKLEQAIHPYLMQRNLLRISLQTAATGRLPQQPLRLTLLLDNSGSMERPDRRQTVRRAIESLAQQLTANDQVTLISFANTPRLLAERVSGAKLDELVQLVENLPSEGGTNLEAALQLALEKSVEQARSADNASAGLNRIIMMTDGAVNLGDADPQRLSELVVQMRQAGIAFDAAGISAHDLNDEVLETLARQGDGRYYLLDASEEVGAGFADQIAGALRPAAKNVKVQVEFNPQRVGQYKLLGFEKHLLNPEDFRNDKIDAAELAAAEAGVALYHFEPKPDGRGDVGSVSVRYQDLSTGLMVERRWPIPYQPQTPRLEQADPRVRIATVAALFAAKLRGDAVAYGTDLNALATTLAELPSSYGSDLRVEQLKFMIETARQLETLP